MMNTHSLTLQHIS